MQLICPYTHTHLTTEVGWKGQNSFYSESGHDAHQIKGNEACNNMLQTVCPYIHFWFLGTGQKVKSFFFSESGHVAYQIMHRMKHTCRTNYKHECWPYTYSGLLGYIKRQTLSIGGHTFSELACYFIFAENYGSLYWHQKSKCVRGMIHKFWSLPCSFVQRYIKRYTMHHSQELALTLISMLIFSCCTVSFNNYNTLYMAHSIPLAYFHVIEV